MIILVAAALVGFCSGVLTGAMLTFILVVMTRKVK